MKYVLLVEDNQDNSDLMCAFLEDLYQVGTCGSASEALEMLDRPGARVPDLFLLDIALPGMDGVELLHEIRQRPQLSAVPAAALTAHAMKGDEQDFLRAGFDAYISKPVLDDEALLRTLSKLIEGANES